AKERETLTEAEGRMRLREDALKQREETFRKRLNDAVETEVRQARREIDDVIAGLKAKSEAIARESARHVSTGDTGAARGDARAGVEAGGKKFPEPQAETAGEGQAAAADAAIQPCVGDRVIVGGLGLEGVITAIHDGAAEIDVRGKRMRANVRDVRVLAA